MYVYRFQKRQAKPQSEKKAVKPNGQMRLVARKWKLSLLNWSIVQATVVSVDIW